MVSSRDHVAESLEIAGQRALWALADEIDVRFREITIESTDRPFPNTCERAWWWKRGPASDEAMRYLRGDY